MALLDEAKKALRISAATTDFDTEVQDLIDAAKADLALAGVLKVDDTDPLIKRAVIVYCKAYFGYDNPDADRLAASYSMLKSHLSLAEDYNSYTITFTVTSGGLPVDGAVITIGDLTLTTNSLGIAVHTVQQAGIDVGYMVTVDGYVTAEGSVYVDGNRAVGVVLVEA